MAPEAHKNLSEGNELDKSEGEELSDYIDENFELDETDEYYGV